MKKVIVLGGSELQLPLIKKCKEKKLYTIVVDYNPNAVGRKFADEFHEISTNDSESIYQLALNSNISAIVTAATDMPMRVVAEVSKRLGLRAISPEVAINCTDKICMIDQLNKHGVRVPKHSTCDDMALLDEQIEGLKFPIILKPSDSSGSRGVCIAESKEELASSFEYAQQYSTSNSVIIEEFIGGDEFSVEVLIRDNQAQIIAITDKETTGKPHFVETGHTQPTSFSATIQEEIRRITYAAVQALGITVGAAHVEIKVEDGLAYIIEVGARLGGDFITSDLTPIATKYDMLGNYLDIVLDDEIIVPDIQHDLFYGIRFLSAPTSGMLKGISHLNTVMENYADYIVEYRDYQKTGDTITLINSGSDRVGHFLLKGPSKEEIDNIFNKIKNSLTIEMVNA